MANPIRGEVDLVAGDKTYRLRLSVNQLIEVEDLTGIGIVQLSGQFNDIATLRAGNVRAVLWGALRQHHPEIDLLGAGDIMAVVGLQPAIEKIAEALQAAFPRAEGQEDPSPNRGQDGTGNRS